MSIIDNRTLAAGSFAGTGEKRAKNAAGLLSAND